MHRFQKPWLMLVAAALLLASTATWLTVASNQDIGNHTRHIYHSEKLGAGIQWVAINAHRILLDDSVPSEMHKQHNQNIIWFQMLTKGSLKEDLPAAIAVDSSEGKRLQEQFTTYSQITMALIQKRTELASLLDGKDAIALAAKELKSSALALVQGLQQVQGGRRTSSQTNQLSNLYTLSLALSDHYVDILSALDGQARYKSIDVGWMRQTLTELSTGPQAPKSTIIRRSANQLLSDIDSFQSQHGSAINRFIDLRADIASRLSNLDTTALTLSEALDQLALELTAGANTIWSMPLLIWLAAVGFALSAATNRLILNKQSNPQRFPAGLSNGQPNPASEVTSSHYLNQFKIDKNKLMSDIKSLGDGILYIKADEHLESTRDLARCYNQSRESLIQRIEAIREKVAELDAQLETRSSQPAETHNDTSIDSNVLEDLTYRAHAEMEGLTRTIKAAATPDTIATDREINMLENCKRTDRILDELRIRVRKGISETPRTQNDEKMQQLIQQLTRNLDAFQTQSPVSRGPGHRINPQTTSRCKQRV